MQQFSDDEGDVDEPLAPLPDEPEVVEGEEDDQDDKEESTPALAPDASREISELPPPSKEEESTSKAPSPKPHPLSMSFQPSGLSADETVEDLDNPLQPNMESSDNNLDIGETNLTMGGEQVDEGETLTLGTPQEMVGGDLDLGVPDETGDGLDLGASMDVEGGEGLDLDLSGLGPDGEAFESAHDLSQMEPTDGILGGSMMDDSMDPFSTEPS